MLYSGKITLGTYLLGLLLAVLPVADAPGQVLEPTVGPVPSSSSSSGDNDSRADERAANPLGTETDLPKFDMGSDVVTWNGQVWNISNNRVARARFEKYLNAPAADSEEDRAYRETIDQMLDLLNPSNLGGKGVDLDKAFQLLPIASNYKEDAKLCDAIANAVYNAWLAQREQDRLTRANKALLEESNIQRRNADTAIQGLERSSRPTSSRSDAVTQEIVESRKQQRELRTGGYLARVAEIEAIRAANKAKKEISEIQAKVQFQSLLVQLFLQRRFEHVLIGTRMYSQVFSSGDTVLSFDEQSETEKVLTEGVGMPATINTLASLAGEAMRDVDEGVEAFHNLLERDQMKSATERLMEAFLIGEFMPKIRTLDFDKKQRVVEFTHKSNRLLSALEMKDYTEAENMVEELREIAKDFEDTKPMGIIETAKATSNFHLNKAKNAAVSGDDETLEEELRAAAEIWPRNPKLEEVSDFIFSQADVQQQAIVDLNQLISQKNYRQIFNDQVRFIAATVAYPERREELEEVLKIMQTIEASLMRSKEMERRGDAIGAWETVERTHEKYPDDSELNNMRAELSRKAANFASIIETAQQLEERNQIGSAFAWYLKAQNLYPASDYAQEGIHRLTGKILPDATQSADLLEHEDIADL